MTCPKTNPRYPDTATRLERPIGVVVRKLDPDFDKERRFDKAYEFGRRVFKEDALAHGGYVDLTLGAEQGFSLATEGGQTLTPENTPSALYAFVTYGEQDGIGPLEALLAEGNWVLRTEDGSTILMQSPGAMTIQDPAGPLRAALDARFRADNGFCDPPDDGTVFTGTGAGGANPGSVPSIVAMKTEGGTLFRTEDGRSLLAPETPTSDYVVDQSGRRVELSDGSFLKENQEDPIYAVGVIFKGA